MRTSTSSPSWHRRSAWRPRASCGCAASRRSGLRAGAASLPDLRARSAPTRLGLARVAHRRVDAELDTRRCERSRPGPCRAADRAARTPSMRPRGPIRLTFSSQAYCFGCDNVAPAGRLAPRAKQRLERRRAQVEVPRADGDGRSPGFPSSPRARAPHTPVCRAMASSSLVRTTSAATRLRSALMRATGFAASTRASEFRSSSSTSPRWSNRCRMRRRIAAAFSPMPPVRTIASTPPMTAAYAPTYLRARCANTWIASRARSSPSAARRSISRRSLPCPESPARPLRWLSKASRSPALMPLRASARITPGSMSPARVPMHQPPRAGSFPCSSRWSGRARLRMRSRRCPGAA